MAVGFKTRPLDRKVDWYFFDPDLALPDTLRSQIMPLEREAAHELWTKFVSPVPHERHPMALPVGHWSDDRDRRCPNWQPSWNNPSDQDPIADFLKSRIQWPDDAEVFFVWGCEYIVKTSWGVFLRTWRSFLFDDEGPFLISLGRPEFVQFGPGGPLAIGRAPALSAASHTDYAQIHGRHSNTASI